MSIEAPNAMTRASDPFEEYLLKKKVEMMQSKFRPPDDDPETEDIDIDTVVSNEDPEVEARLKDEVDDFFTTGQTAAAELFNDVVPKISEDKVEEIRDALDDVFEDDTPKPETVAVDQSETFVDFFNQVRTEYKGERPPPAAAPPTESAPLVLEDAPPPPPAPSAPVAPVAQPVERQRVRTALPDPTPEHPDILITTAEISTDDLGLAAPQPPSNSGPRADTRLILGDILTPPPTEEELRRRVDVLSRLVAKLIERSNLPESEIIEVLIKAGVEF